LSGEGKSAEGGETTDQEGYAPMSLTLSMVKTLCEVKEHIRGASAYQEPYCQASAI